MANIIVRPGISHGLYPQREDQAHSFISRLSAKVEPLFQRPNRLSSGQLKRINRYGKRFERLDAKSLRQEIPELRLDLQKQGLKNTLVLQSFALIRDMADRTLGMRHYEAQLKGGWVMMHGMLAEMETGEGKTLAATLPAATAAFAGTPVHVVTVNDYLAKRDASNMAPLYRALGLTVGVAVTGMTPAQRREAYACDITYCTNKQLAFDYLRDRMVLGGDSSQLRLQLEKLHDENSRVEKLLLRGLCFAIVDEADSVFIDEARTPLVISRQQKNENEQTIYAQALSLTSLFQETRDFSIDKSKRKIDLTEQGRALLTEVGPPLGGVWTGERRRQELLLLALKAQYLFQRDRHYLIQRGKIRIIDETTGRLMPERSWDRGLQQMIEAKESCELSGEKEAVAQLTYQRLFRRYLKLAGMTGTAREDANELRAVYHLSVVAIPPNHALRRKRCVTHIYGTKAAKWTAVCRRIEEMCIQGRPVLVGTRSVEDSEQLSELLNQAELAHQVLNARQDAYEAQIISKAGEVGQITVATNMAGRGTDIKLGHGVADVGGLHVIATEWNEARRIDRQLIGRCGRQGDPGSYEAMLSVEDELVQLYSPVLARFLMKLANSEKNQFSQKLIAIFLRLGQRRVESAQRQMRHDLLKMDQQLGKLLAFSGRQE